MVSWRWLNLPPARMSAAKTPARPVASACYSAGPHFRLPISWTSSTALGRSAGFSLRQQNMMSTTAWGASRGTLHPPWHAVRCLPP